MPELSRFFGILIFMYFDEHNPPHFHAKYNEYDAEIDLHGNIIEGTMPGKQMKFIRA